MAKVTIVMNFDCDGFDNAEDSDKFFTIEDVLNTGAEAMNADIKIQSITLR